LDVLVISANRNRHPAPVMPYGACMVAEAVARAGHRVRLLDLMFARDPLKAVETEIVAFSPQAVGLSARNLDNNDMQAPVEYVSQLAAITRVIRKTTDAPLVLGGPAVGVMPEPLLRLTGASCAVLGDGEAAFPALLDALESQASISQAPRVGWLENDSLRVSSDAPCGLSASGARPRFGRWLDLKAYRANLAATPLQSKRGCPFNCVYCTYGISEGREYRLLPAGEVGAAVRHLAAQGHRDIEFVDNVFNSPYDHALAVCDALAEKPHGARLTTVELNPAFVDDRLLGAMTQAGFVGVGLTAESAADEALAGLEKGYSAAEVKRAADAVRRSRLPCFWLFLLGGPGETEATVKQTLDFARRVLRPVDVAFINVGIRVYPGTALERLARREGALSLTPQEMLAPVFYFSPDLNLEWTLNQVRRAAADKLNILHSASLSHPWLPAINRLFSRLPVARPLWRHTRTLRRVIRALGRDI
jgi:radical SAM superfamily enzyme YgiQ (UPF0313 family)